jgi:hypothetical protein
VNQENAFAESGTSPTPTKTYAGASYTPGCCQDPQCAQCCESGSTPGARIGALPPRGYMISNGSLIRDPNHDLPALPNAWTEAAQRIIRAIQVDTGCDRMAAIRAYRRGDAIARRRFCADTSAGDYHFLPADARGNVLYCDASCRASAA